MKYQRKINAKPELDFCRAWPSNPADENINKTLNTFPQASFKLIEMDSLTRRGYKLQDKIGNGAYSKVVRATYCKASGEKEKQLVCKIGKQIAIDQLLSS